MVRQQAPNIAAAIVLTLQAPHILLEASHCIGSTHTHGALKACQIHIFQFQRFCSKARYQSKVSPSLQAFPSQHAYYKRDAAKYRYASFLNKHNIELACVYFANP